MRQHRMNYWSLSPFAKWLREKAGLTNPYALTAEGWANYILECKTKAPFIYWLTNTAFNKAQDICYFPADVYWNIKTATIWKFFRNLWTFKKALWNYRSWDYSGLLHLMETATMDMSECHRNHGHAVNSWDTANELYILSKIIQRVREHDYHEDKEEFVKTGKRGLFGGYEFIQRPNTLPSRKAKSFYKLTEQQRKDDWQLVCKILSRKTFTYWD